MSIAEQLDEIAFNHYKHSFYTTNQQESERALNRSYFLRDIAVLFGAKYYCYLQRLQYERDYQECID